MPSNVLLPALLLVLLTAGCSFKIGKEDSSFTTLEAHDSFSLQSGCYVTLPEDYELKGNKERNSGKKAQESAIKGLSKAGVQAVSAMTSLTREQAIENAKQVNTGMVVELEILLWEDPPSFIDNMPDHGEIKVHVINASTGDAIRTDILECRNFPGHFMNISSGGPEDCLKGAFKKWAEALR